MISLTFWMRKNLDGLLPALSSVGKSFVNMLADVTRNVDGNHPTLQDDGYGVPALFGQFKGYKQPEKKTRRERSI